VLLKCKRQKDPSLSETVHETQSTQLTRAAGVPLHQLILCHLGRRVLNLLPQYHDAKAPDSFHASAEDDNGKA
jgi:hypothetical protein